MVGVGAAVEAEPHAFGIPAPPHVSGAEHVPHDSIAVQPSEMSPQVAANCSQVRGTHVPPSGPAPVLPVAPLPELPPQATRAAKLVTTVASDAAPPRIRGN